MTRPHDSMQTVSQEPWPCECIDCQGPGPQAQQSWAQDHGARGPDAGVRVAGGPGWVATWNDASAGHGESGSLLGEGGAHVVYTLGRYRGGSFGTNSPLDRWARKFGGMVRMACTGGAWPDGDYVSLGTRPGLGPHAWGGLD